jgi:hypothetical protein
MTDFKAGDRIVVESEHVGKAGREGEVLEVLGAGETVHYRVRWENEHESTFYPSAGSAMLMRKPGLAATK